MTLKVGVVRVIYFFMRRTCNMKKTINILSALTIVAALTTGFTACSNDDIALEQPTEQSAVAKTYTMNIPATMPNDDTRAVAFNGTICTSTFESTEKIYVYNTTKSAMLDGYLQPANISANGKGCDLTGSLTGTIEAGDELQLFYNMNNLCSFPIGHMYYDKEMNLFYYTDQDGTPSTIVDGAVATVTVSDYSSSALTTTATASFQSVQSMFRFQFKDENNNAINVKSLKIKSKNDALVDCFRPLAEDPDDLNQYDNYNITLGTATTDYIYLGIRIDESRSAGDELTFTIFDADGNDYKGTKSVPASGFKNGKYYYNTSAIQLTKVVRTAPTITWTSVSDNQEVTPDENALYHIYGVFNTSETKFEPSEITISGTSEGYWFWMDYGATVHLNNLNAVYDGMQQFIYYSGGNLNLDINGTNNIVCKNYSQAIVSSKLLKLSGNGTLTVTTNDADELGLWGSNYQSSNKALSDLAADGYTVTRSARTDNPDGSYTWTYTVVTNP